MQDYIEFLKSTTITIAKSNALIFSLLLVFLIIVLLFRKKYNVRNIIKAISVLLSAIVIESGFLLIPRVIDIKQESFVIIENANLVVDSTNSTYEDGSIMFYGTAYIIDSQGKSNYVLGLNFFDLSSMDPNKDYYGTAVYAEHSKQLIEFETVSKENFDMVPVQD